MLDLKQKNKEFVWDSAINSICGGKKLSECEKNELPRNPDILIFLWQDNNSVIGKASETFLIGLLSITPTSAANGCPLLPIMCLTVHSIHLPTDVIEKLRRKPRVTFINAKNVRDVFLYNARLKLFIPLAINNYNYHINGTDMANQRRKHLIT
jgi:hypothetical protein